MDGKNLIRDYLKEFPNFLSLLIRPVFFIVLSPILLEASLSLNTSIRNLNLVFTFFTIGNLLGNLSSIFYNKKFKKLNIIIFSYVILIALNIALSFSRSLHFYYFLYLIGGYTIGIIWFQANQFIAESKIKNKTRLNMVALSFYPIGSLVAPFIVIAIISNNFNWWFVYYAVSIIAAINILLYLTIIWKKEYLTQGKQQDPIIFKGIFIDKNKNTIITIRVILTILYTLPVTVIITWFPTFFRIEKMFDYREAGLTVSVFYISMIAGRFIIIFLEKKLKMSYIILIFVMIGFVSLILMIFTNQKYIIFSALVTAGVGFSGLFPFLVSTVSLIYENGKGILLTILFSAEGLGQAMAPYITGVLSKYNMALSVSLSVIATALIILLLITDIIYRKKYPEVKLI